MWPLYFLSFFDFVLSVIPRFTTSDYSFGILWPLYCLSLLVLRLLITPLVYCGHCIFCPSSIYGFWFPLWYLVTIVLYVLPRYTTYDYPFGILWPLYCPSVLDYDLWLFGILWPLYCLSFFDLRLLVTPLISCGHCIVCPSSIYDFWLPFWYPVAIVLSVLPRFTSSDYPFGIFWPLFCLSFPDLRLLITPLVSCGHCIVCPSSIYDFWLPFWYLLAIVLSVLPRFTTSDYPFGILWPLYCLSFLDLRLLITPLVSCGHCIFVLPRFTIFNYPFGILWPLYCLSFLHLQLLITPLVTCSHCIVCPFSIYDFWLPLWYLVAIVLSVLPRFCIICPSSIYDFWLPLWYLVAIVFSVILRFCIVCHSSIYDFWLPFWYLVAIVLSFPPRFTTSDYPFGILWPLYFLSFLDLRLLISPLVSCDHCIVCHSSILYCLSFLDLRLLITLLVSFGHCVVCTSSIYDFWLPLWYLVAVILSVLPRFTTSDYPFGILWPLYFRPSSIYDF